MNQKHVDENETQDLYVTSIVFLGLSPGGRGERQARFVVKTESKEALLTATQLDEVAATSETEVDFARELAEKVRVEYDRLDAKHKAFMERLKKGRSRTES